MTKGQSLRIAIVGPVATSVPPPGGSSVELLTALLCNGLVDRGQQVTLFATGNSRTKAALHVTFPRGYSEDPSLWPWEMTELFNLAAAVERSGNFDIVHYHAMFAPLSLAFSRLSRAPMVHTVHHGPRPSEIAMWSRYKEAAFIAISRWQARVLDGLNVVATVPNGIDTSAFTFREHPDDYLVFIGRLVEAKGVLEAIDIARRVGMKLRLAGKENDYFHEVIAPHVDGVNVVYVGEVDHTRKNTLLGGARAMLAPVQDHEPFGLTGAEAAACGTPVAALNRGAMREAIHDGVTGVIAQSVDELVARMPEVLALDRRRVRTRAVEMHDAARMVDGYLDVYKRLIAGRMQVA